MHPPTQAGLDSKRVGGFECATSGEAIFEFSWASRMLPDSSSVVDTDTDMDTDMDTDGDRDGDRGVSLARALCETLPSTAETSLAVVATAVTGEARGRQLQAAKACSQGDMVIRIDASSCISAAMFDSLLSSPSTDASSPASTGPAPAPAPVLPPLPEAYLAVLQDPNAASTDIGVYVCVCVCGTQMRAWCALVYVRVCVHMRARVRVL